MAEGNPPLYLRFGMTDTANAMVSVVGVLAALYHQRRTGEGQDLWTSLRDHSTGAFDNPDNTYVLIRDRLVDDFPEFNQNKSKGP